MSTSSATAGPRTDAWFATTHWSVVLSARDKVSPQSDDALEKLCRTYWCPLYAFVRRQGRNPSDAADLTQEFFTRLLEKDYLHRVAREKGRFRTFLLVTLKRFLADEWDRARAQKRGGGTTPLSLDAEMAEQRYRVEPVESMTPEKIYERHWALALLDQAMARLRQEFVSSGKTEEFERLKPFLTADRRAIPYAEMAAKVGLSAGALRVAVHRLRRRFRELFREEIAHTVANPGEIDEEVRYLFGVLGG